MSEVSKPHSVQREGTAYEGDQPVTYEIRCSCGEVFDHIAPENARRQWREHASESNQHSELRDVARRVVDRPHTTESVELTLAEGVLGLYEQLEAAQEALREIERASVLRDIPDDIRVGMMLTVARAALASNPARRRDDG